MQSTEICKYLNKSCNIYIYVQSTKALMLCLAMSKIAAREKVNKPKVKQLEKSSYYNRLDCDFKV